MIVFKRPCQRLHVCRRPEEMGRQGTGFGTTGKRERGPDRAIITLFACGSQKGIACPLTGSRRL